MMKPSILWGMSSFLILVIAGCDSSSNSATSSSSSSTTSIAYGTLTDSRDGQIYKTVKIGNQTWMAQSLNYKVDSSWCPNNDPTYCSARYGRLYKWATAMSLPDSCNSKVCSAQITSNWQGICPTGWHIPSDSEWGVLIAYVGVDSAGTKLKSTNGWKDTSGNSAGNGTNQYGFNVLPAGVRFLDRFSFLGINANFWSSSEIDTSNDWTRFFHYEYIIASRDFEANGGVWGDLKWVSSSLRCIQN